MTMTKKALIAGAFLTAAGIAGTATAGAPVFTVKLTSLFKATVLKALKKITSV